MRDFKQNRRWFRKCYEMRPLHTRTVVRECCKGDDASQWENWKFDPLPCPNPLTDRHQKLHTWLGPRNLYQRVKFSRDPSRGFFSPYTRNCTSKMFTRLLFWVLPRSTTKAPEPIFTHNTSNHAVPRKDVAFGVRKENLNIYTPYSRKKTPPFWARFWRGKIFGREPLYNGGAPM